MEPVVHGLEKQYEGRVDFLYLNVAEARNDSAKPRVSVDAALLPGRSRGCSPWHVTGRGARRQRAARPRPTPERRNAL